jgi:hypothetical protein
MPEKRSIKNISSLLEILMPPDNLPASEYYCIFLRDTKSSVLDDIYIILTEARAGKNGFG